MEKEFLDLVPKRFLCPYCGEWHEWQRRCRLGYYDSKEFVAHLECAARRPECKARIMGFYFEEDKCHYTTFPSCRRANLELDGSIPIANIVESLDKPQVTFDVIFAPHACIGNSACSDCDSRDDNCQLVKLADAGDWHQITLKFGFEFEQSDYDKYAKTAIAARQERERQERELKQRNPQKTVNQPTNQEIKENTNMAKNVFNMNLEFGLCKDENIASTFMGVAVKSGDNWRIYDKAKAEITDVGDMQLGNFPIFILPTTKLAEGDLVKYEGEYYFVNKIESGVIKALCVKTGEVKSLLPIKNLMGFSCYSKLVAINDFIDVGTDFDIEKLAIMSAMCGQNGAEAGQMNQLLPLMLLKDKDNMDDGVMKMMLMTSLMSAPADDKEQNATMNQLLPLMLLKDKSGMDDDIMKMMYMSSMMGSGTAGANNPMMIYLMLDMFKDKKKDETPSLPPPAGGQTTN